MNSCFYFLIDNVQNYMNTENENHDIDDDDDDEAELCPSYAKPNSNRTHFPSRMKKTLTPNSNEKSVRIQVIIRNKLIQKQTFI